VLPACCPDLFHLLEVVTPVTVLPKKVCTIIVAKRIKDLTKILRGSKIKKREEKRKPMEMTGGEKEPMEVSGTRPKLSADNSVPHGLVRRLLCFFKEI